MAQKPKRTPEEIEALKAKYAAENAEKAKKKEEKKEAFGEKNKNTNLPTIEVRLPWQHENNGKVYEIDLEKEPWKSLPSSYEQHWRRDHEIHTGKPYNGDVRYKIIRM